MVRLTKGEQKKAARERIEELFIQARLVFDKYPEFANRYVEIILTLRNRYHIRLTKQEKTQYCKNCHSFLSPGKNSSIRLTNKMLIVTCQECGYARKLLNYSQNAKEKNSP